MKKGLKRMRNRTDFRAKHENEVEAQSSPIQGRTPHDRTYLRLSECEYPKCLSQQIYLRHEIYHLFSRAQRAPRAQRAEIECSFFSDTREKVAWGSCAWEGIRALSRRITRNAFFYKVFYL